MDMTVVNLFRERVKQFKENTALWSKDKKGVLHRANKQEKPMQASDLIKDPYILYPLNLKAAAHTAWS